MRRIQFQTQNLSNQKRLGEVSSSFKGFGMSFSEVREYQFGDETRLWIQTRLFLWRNTFVHDYDFHHYKFCLFVILVVPTP